MKLVKAEQTKDVVVLNDGEFNLGIRATARLLGVSHKSIQNWLVSRHPNYNIINGLDYEMLSLVATYFAFEARTNPDAAKEVAKKLMLAGAKAFVLSIVGYRFDASKQQGNTKALPAPEGYISNALLTLTV